MSNRIPIIFATLIIISIGSIWYVSRAPRIPRSEQVINTLIIGTNTDFPPFSYLENDTITGFDIDVAKEIAKRLGKPYQFKAMSFDALIPEMQMGSVHLIAAGMTPSKERAKRVFFAPAHFNNDPLVAISKPASEPISKGHQLIGKKVIVNQGYTADQYVSDLGNVEVIRVSSPLVSTGVMALQGGEADAFVASKQSLKPFLQKKKIDNVITPIDDTGESSAVAVSKKHPALFASIEKAVTDMINDGTIATLIKKWNLDD